ncbi:hypothetical protein [Amycolatopsis sp. CA-230715]|uniref:hypothetical protein n=1 Tax=Amycolatopsis sp. CA-230715 TaxID=2745196 RepID=UPI001C039ACD|nr:hypothetical protein [Amycolatopsis sp. CA-230715]
MTVDNYAEVLALAEAAVKPAEEKRDRLKARYEGRTAPRSEVETDPASAFRRKTARQARKAETKFDLDMEAYKAYDAAEQEYKSCLSRVEWLRKVAPVPYTEEELRAATAVRLDDGWYRLVRVNKVTVSVEAGFPWPLKYKRDRILEVRPREVAE